MLPDQLIAGVAEAVEEGRVDGGDAAVVAERDEAARRIVQQVIHPRQH
jgi:hypothetical protein